METRGAERGAERPVFFEAPFVRRDWIFLAGSVGLALALRLVYLWQYRSNPLFADPIMDPLYHDQWARAFARGESFMEGEAYFRAPLYPWFLGLCYKIFGAGYVAPRVVQHLLGALSCGLVFLIGRRCFGRAVGAASGIAAATFWLFIYFEGELLIEPLFLFLCLAFLWGFIEARRTGSLLLFAASGFCMGLAALARPNILLFGVAACVWLLLEAPRAWRPGLGRALVFGGACLVPILPVTARNYTAGDDLVLISSQGGLNFYIGNNPTSDGTTAVVPGTRAGWWEGYYDSIAQAEAAAGQELKPSGVSRHFSRRALEFVRESPGAWLELTLKKAGFFWKSAEFANNQPIRFFAETFAPVVKLLPIGFGLISPLALIGLAFALRRPRRNFPLWGFVVFYALSVILFFVCTRYKIPAVPVLIILACAAVERIVAWARTRRLAPAAVAAAAAGLLAWWVNIPPAHWADSSFAGWSILGDAAQNRGDLERAAACYDEALRRLAALPGTKPPYEANLTGKLGIVLLKQGRLDAAQETLMRVTRMRVRHPSEGAMAALGLGCVARLQDDLERARHFLRKAIEFEPANVAARLELARVAAKQENAAEAVGLVREALDIWRRNQEAWLLLAGIYEEFNEPARAVACLEEGLAAFPPGSEEAREIAARLDEARGAAGGGE